MSTWICPTLYAFCGKPDMKGIRCKHKNRVLAAQARRRFIEDKGVTPEAYLADTPDVSGWLEDRLLAECIIGANP